MGEMGESNRSSPKVGETILGNSFGTSFGGKGANQAVMAAKLGGNTAMITKLGRDTLGANYSDNFAELKVSTAPALATSLPHVTCHM